MSKIVLLVAFSLVLGSCNKPKPNVKTDKGKFSYAVGFEIGKNMKKQGVELDYGSFLAALEHVMGDKKALLDEKQRREALQKMSEIKRKKDDEASKKNLEVGKKFLETNKAKDGVKVTASGLQYKVLKPGTGVQAKSTDKVKVHYTGTLTDGTKFDSSHDRKQPAEFPLNGGVIKGWQEGVPLMKVGAKYKFWIPSELGYGARANPRIPGNSVLVFEVELLEIVTGKKKAPAKAK